MIAAYYRLAEILFQVVDCFDHPRVRTAEEIAVGVGSSILLNNLDPLFRRDGAVAVAFKAEAQFMEHRKTGFAEVLDLVLVGLFHIGTDEHEFLDAEVRKCLPDSLGRLARSAVCATSPSYAAG